MLWAYRSIKVRPRRCSPRASSGLSDLQERLYAYDRWSVLIVLQAMDAAGKDSVIKHVMAASIRRAVEVHPFKQPSAEELDHDFLWRVGQAPAGARAHRHLQSLAITRKCWWFACTRSCCEQQKLPSVIDGKDIWQQRFEDIRAFERHLARNGTLVLKFFLQCFEGRATQALSRPHRRAGQTLEVLDGRCRRAQALGQYMAAYEDMIREHQPAGRALVRRARRPQMVHAPGGCRRARARASTRSISISRGSRARRSRNCRKHAKP